MSDLEWICKKGRGERWRAYGVAASGRTVLQTTASYATQAEAAEAVRSVSEATERARRAERTLTRHGIIAIIAAVALAVTVGFGWPW